MYYATELAREHLGGVLDALLRGAPNAVAVLDREMRYIAYGQRWLEAYRLGERELLGLSHYEVFPEIGEEWKAIHRDCLNGAERSREKEPFVRADGGIDYVSWWVGPWHETDGSVGGLVMHTSVQSGQMLMEQELGSLLESTRAVPWRLEAASREFVFMGPQVEALLGYPASSWRGVDDWIARVHPDDRERAEAYAEAVLNGEVESAMEYRLLRADGGDIWVHDVFTPIYDDAGVLKAITGFFIDISEKVAALEGMRLQERRYREAIEATGDGFWLVDDKGELIDCNEAYARLSGYTRDELIGMRITDLEAAENPEETAAHIEKIVRTGYDLFETRHRRKDGTIWDVEISTTFRKGVFSVFARDISERKRLLQELKLVGEVFKNTGEGIVITDPEGTIVDVNDAYCRIMGYEREQIIGQNPRMVGSGRHDKAFYEEMWRAIREDGQWLGEVWDRRSNGEVFPKWLNISTVYNDEREITHYVGTFSDISALKDVQEQLQQLAYYDALTGLPNRLLFQDRLEQEISICRRLDHQCAVMFLDLDRFKYVNDTLGHSAGDELLIEVARRIKQHVRDNDTVARLGGDEFTLILREVGSVDAVAMVARKVVEELGRPFSLMGNEVHLGGSIGITLYPDDGLDFETLTKRADAAMYQAKGAGRGQYHFYSQLMDENAHHRLRLENDLHRAIERDELFLHYQPQLAADGERVVGAEALVRWRHPELGVVSPAEFIPLAEESGVIIPIGEWVTQQVCADMRRWREAGMVLVPVAINLSARQFRQSDLISRIIEIIGKSGLESGLFEFEITESVAMDNPDAVAARLKVLAGRGYSIAIDDFGTGYSSLGYLKKFTAHKIKLDRSFVADIPDDEESLAVASAVINMAKELGYRVVAEGVESEGQHHFLRDKGCDVMQGYHFSRPLEAEAFEAFIRG